MKTTIAIALFCTSLFACQASEKGTENNSITVGEDSLSSTIESSEASDGSFALGPLIISALFTPDGPDGPEPYTFVEASCKPMTKTIFPESAKANVGDGCCGQISNPGLSMSKPSAPHNHNRDLSTPSN